MPTLTVDRCCEQWQIRNNHGGGYSYRLCPATELLTEACFKKHQLDFVADQQAVVFPDGTLLPIKEPVFVTEGTTPPGSMWSRMPMPPTGLGPCCIPGPGDNASTPHSCSNQAFDQCGEIGPEGCSCHPCPESPGSDCSRCANCGLPGFEPPCPSCQGVDWHGNAVKDRVKIPASLAPGNYVLGFRYE